MPDNCFPNLPLIRDSITILYRHFGFEGMRRFFAPIPRLEVEAQDPLHCANAIAWQLARHLDITPDWLRVTFTPYAQEPGRVRRDGPRTFHIEIHENLEQLPGEQAAVLAHEVIHVLLMLEELEISDKFTNEILTDTTTAYLGLGWLCLDAYRLGVVRVDSYHVASWEQRLGYLTPQEFGYVLAKRARISLEQAPNYLTGVMARQAFDEGRKLVNQEAVHPPIKASPHTWMPYTWRRWRHQRTDSTASPDSRASALVTHTPDEKRGYRHYGFVWEGETQKVVFRCPLCCQRLRLPTRMKHAQVDCPTCGCTQQCST